YGVINRWSKPAFVLKRVMTWFTNSLPLSDCTIIGIPKSQNTGMMAFTTDSAVLSLIGLKMTNRLHMSTITSRYVLCSAVVGNGPVKSIAQWSPGNNACMGLWGL
ncbi:hypothetical protein, partial, partial [Absidia glauca]